MSLQWYLRVLWYAVWEPLHYHFNKLCICVAISFQQPHHIITTNNQICQKAMWGFKTWFVSSMKKNSLRIFIEDPLVYAFKCILEGSYCLKGDGHRLYIVQQGHKPKSRKAFVCSELLCDDFSSNPIKSPHFKSVINKLIS